MQRSTSVTSIAACLFKRKWNHAGLLIVTFMKAMEGDILNITGMVPGSADAGNVLCKKSYRV